MINGIGPDVDLKRRPVAGELIAGAWPSDDNLVLSGDEIEQ